LFASIILIAYYRPKFKPITFKHQGILLLIAFLMFIQFYFTFTGYALYGVNYTTLILTTVPVFVYFFDWIFLKEKIKPKILLAAAVILLSILAVQLLG
jgi:drug/metabolite transporter (DMT)-like permease